MRQLQDVQNERVKAMQCFKIAIYCDFMILKLSLCEEMLTSCLSLHATKITLIIYH